MPSKFFALVPAAGGGTRFASPGAGERPKQYTAINGAPMLRHAVAALLAAKEIEQVFVVLAQGDELFAALDWAKGRDRVAPLYCGGAERRDSVLNGLIAMASQAEPDDWVLVHDAARPCLGSAELRRLIDGVRDSREGGILAVRVADTLKRGDHGNAIVATEPRDGLWQAQTPQMFRYAVLVRALREAPHVTDEASAVERLGLRPKLIEGSPRNLKVTYVQDLELAALILGAQP